MRPEDPCLNGEATPAVQNGRSSPAVSHGRTVQAWILWSSLRRFAPCFAIG